MLVSNTFMLVTTDVWMEVIQSMLVTECTFIPLKLLPVVTTSTYADVKGATKFTTTTSTWTHQH